MRAGMPLSILLHGALLAYALVSFAKTEPFKTPEPEPVEIAIITEDGLTRLRQGDRASKLLEAKAAPPAPKSDQVKEVKRPKPPEPAAPPPEPAAAPPAKPDPIAEKLAMLPPEPKGPTPEEIARQQAEQRAAEAKAAAEAEALAKAEAARKAEEEKKRKAAEDKKKADDKRRRELAEKKRREQQKQKQLAEQKRKQEAEKKRQKQQDFFSEMQKALKDNDPTKKAARTGGTNIASNAKQRGPTAGAPEGTDTQLTASQSAMLGLMIKDAVKRCWTIQTGAEGIENIVVKVDVRLNPDGSFAREPRVVNSMPGPLFTATADSAIRAVKQCGPYDFPKTLYKGGWESLIWTFDPRRMF